ncbi:phage holin family protein [Aurantiacibacter flavus]|uniref:Phage holin family protein n=1 Tax=Aurantiacibacter flavus TaxID=3145232 RepID=A0ABV0CXN4_9SPHN
MATSTPDPSAELGSDPDDQPGSTQQGSPDSGSDEPFVRILAEDIAALASDALNYFDAEIAFQKTRMRLAGNRLVTAIALGIVAVVFVLLAAIGLTVGLLIALIPLVTAWGATAIVVAALLLLAWLAIRSAQGAIGSIKSAFAQEDVAPGDDADA